jgi:carbon monoxide dehydrogenase subunit G
MNEFQIVRDIERAPEDVFAALVNFKRMPDWNTSVVEVRVATDGELRVDSTLVYVGRFLGRSFESTSRVTAYAPTAKFATASTSGPFLLEIDNSLESLDGRTRLTTDYRGESRGFFKLAEPVIVRLAKNLFETSTENLKALLEAGAI